MSSLVRAVKGLLNDTKIYLKQLSDEQYILPLPILSGSSIGQHTRHLIEFFQCVLIDDHSETVEGKRVINYDDRKRNVCIECEAASALQMISDICDHMIEIDLDRSIWLAYTDYDFKEVSLIPSSIERELFYNVEHAIHHFALIKIGLQQIAPEINLPPHFGVAPSTISYRNKEKQSTIRGLADFPPEKT